jgi:hypothetical protein
LVKLVPSPARRGIAGTRSQTQPEVQAREWKRWLFESGSLPTVDANEEGCAA